MSQGTRQASPPRHRALASIAVVVAVGVASVIIYRAQVVSSPPASPASTTVPVSTATTPTKTMPSTAKGPDQADQAVQAGQAGTSTSEHRARPGTGAPAPRVHFSGSKAFVPSVPRVLDAPDASPQQGSSSSNADYEFIRVPDASDGQVILDPPPRVFFSGSKSALPPRPAAQPNPPPRVFFSGSKSALPPRTAPATDPDAQSATRPRP